MGSEIVVNGRHFALTQFHFHSPSEHQWNGTRYAMEIHFVHEAVTSVEGGNNKAVIALFLEKSSYDDPGLGPSQGPR